MNTLASPGVLFVTSYPPRECGIATYTRDLRSAIDRQFKHAFHLPVCALNNGVRHEYAAEVEHTIETHLDTVDDFDVVAAQINANRAVSLVHIQHEFGLFGGDYGERVLRLAKNIKKPIVVTFHTVLPDPTEGMLRVVRTLADLADSSVVMTHQSAGILTDFYGIARRRIHVVPHGTHLSPHREPRDVRQQLGLGDHRILSTFGLLGPNKAIETAIDALPAIVANFPDVLYLVIGKTHPGVVAHSGESYRTSLEQRVEELGLHRHVRFINEYLSTEDLLAYLAATDVYLFTSRDPMQAVSGTFAYALASGCPVVATPIPHVREALPPEAGVIAEFGNPASFSDGVIGLLSDPARLASMRVNALHHTRATAWENVAIRHAHLYMAALKSDPVNIHPLPSISLAHVERLTTAFGMVQFSKGGIPDPTSGYTLDDNARAAIVVCLRFALTGEARDLELLATYLKMMARCQKPDGGFINYFTEAGEPHACNDVENLEDANGRAVWALGTILAHQSILPIEIVSEAKQMFRECWGWVGDVRSPRAVAYLLKGLTQAYEADPTEKLRAPIRQMAEYLASRFDDASDGEWQWFEHSLTYANGVFPEAMLAAYLCTGTERYRAIAEIALRFLLKHTISGTFMRTVSNNGWFHRGKERNDHGEQSIDVASAVEALTLFDIAFPEAGYREPRDVAMSWYTGNNHLRQIMYDPASGGCYDGLEQHHVNINQGAESTVSYLIARLTVEAAVKQRLLLTANVAVIPA